MTGRVPSALRERPRDRAVEDRAVERRQLHGGDEAGAPTFARSTGSSPTSVVSMAIGSLWPHQMATDGWWPSRRTAASAWRTACLRTLRA